MDVQDQLKNDIKHNRGSSTPLRDTDTNPEPLRIPCTGPNVCKNIIIIMKYDFTDKGGDMKPLESKLNKTVMNRDIGIGKIQSGSTYGDTMMLSVSQSFKDHRTVFDTASYTFKESLLCLDFDVIVRKHKTCQAFLHD